MPNRLTSKTKTRIISGRDDALLGYFKGFMLPPHSQWKLGQCWLSVRLFFGGQHSRRDVGLVPRLHGTAALSMVMLSAGLL